MDPSLGLARRVAVMTSLLFQVGKAELNGKFGLQGGSKGDRYIGAGLSQASVSRRKLAKSKMRMYRARINTYKLFSYLLNSRVRKD
jgi:hypothetical protein